MLRLVWAFGRNAEVVGLFLRELGQLHADAFEVRAGDFFVEMLRQTIHADWVFVAAPLDGEWSSTSRGLVGAKSLFENGCSRFVLLLVLVLVLDISKDFEEEVENEDEEEWRK